MTLPISSSQGQLHIFALSVATPNLPPTATGTPSPVATAPAGELDLAALANNTGVSSDSDRARGNFDVVGYSYSAEALQAVGLRAGQQVQAGGSVFLWPSAAVGAPDNVAAQGQTIDLPAPTVATLLTFLGASDHGPAVGTGTFTFSDGTTQHFDLGLSDWTLNGNTASAPEYGNTIVATMPYRNIAGGPQVRDTYVFSVAIPVHTRKPLIGITLPAPTGQGRIHIFAATLS